jgi:tetratricopeptide (TPR) repeat protein
MKITLIAFLFVFITSISFAQNTLSYTQIEAHFNNGIELFEKKAYPAARKELHEYIKLSEGSLNPNRFNIANATYYSAVSSLYSKAKDADIEVERFVVKYPDHPKAKIIFKDLADMYFEKGQYDDAILYYEKSLGNRADNIATYEIRYKLGVAYYIKKDYKNALIQFDIVKNTISPSSLNAAYYAGVIHFQNQNYQSAYTDLKRVENVSPYKTDIPNWLGQILFRQKKYTELLEYAEPIIANQNGRKVDELALLVAEVYYMNDDFTKAAMYYDKHKSFKKVTSDIVNFRHAYSYYKIENFEKSAQIFRNTANQNSELGQQSAYYLGISALKTGDINAAMLAFEEAKKTNFDLNIKEEAEYNYIKVLVEKNNNPKAISSLQAYLKAYPNGKYIDESNELLSDILSESNSYANAITYIESLKKRTPKIDETYQKLCYNQGIQEFNLEKFEAAIPFFDKAIKTKSNSEIEQQAKFWKAESFAQLNKSDAERLFTELSTTANSEIRLKAIYSLAYLKFNAKDYSAAKGQFSSFYNDSKAIANLDANREDALVRLADCHLAAKEYTQALSLYDRAYIENKADKDYALYQKGLTLKFMDKDAEAKDVFERFSKLYGNSRLIDDALFQNGVLEMDKGTYANAITTFTELLRKKPNSILVPQVLLKRALSFANLQNHEKAILDYKLILDKFSKTKFADEALLGVKESLNAVNRSEDFAEIANQYQKNNPNSSSGQDLQFEAAKDMYFAEKYEKAITAFQQYNNTYSGSGNIPESKFLIAESYFMINKKSEALAYYEDLVSNNQISYLSKSAMRAADIHYAAGTYDGAIRNYTQVESNSSSPREILIAQEGLYKSYFFKNDADKCIEVCNEILASSSTIVINAQNRATLWKGKALMQKKEYQTAKLEFQKTITLGKDISGAEAKYLIGNIQYLMKEYDNSIKTCQELSNDFSDYEIWYEKAFLLIADNYIAKNDIFMANATLKSIIENSSNPETIELAKNKLKTIAK